MASLPVSNKQQTVEAKNQQQHRTQQVGIAANTNTDRG
jgi:hypothetical protein